MRRAHEPEQCDTPPRAGELAFIVRIVELERIEIIGADVGTGDGDVTRVVAACKPVCKINFYSIL